MTDARLAEKYRRLAADCRRRERLGPAMLREWEAEDRHMYAAIAAVFAGETRTCVHDHPPYPWADNPAG